MKREEYVQAFINKKKEAFKKTLHQLTEYGITIRSYHQLHEQLLEVENALPIEKRLIIHAYRDAILVSTLEAILKDN